MIEPEKNCPQCKGLIDWKVIYDEWGFSEFSGLCRKCNIVLKGRETPDLKKGRLLAYELPLDIHPMDKRITQHNAYVQLGFLRAKQHCEQCGNSLCDPCKCKNCDCIYCQERKCCLKTIKKGLVEKSHDPN